MRCKDRLEAHLREQGVPFQTQRHPIAFTAQEVATSELIPGRMVVEAVMVVADGKAVMLALQATDRVELRKLAAVLGVTEVRLAEEREFGALFPDCELGAVPPFGHLYGRAGLRRYCPGRRRDDRLPSRHAHGHDEPEVRGLRPARPAGGHRLRRAGLTSVRMDRPLRPSLVARLTRRNNETERRRPLSSR